MWKGEAVSVMENTIENKVAGIVQDILRDYQSDRAIDKIDLFHQPDKEVVIDIVQKLIQIIFRVITAISLTAYTMRRITCLH